MPEDDPAADGPAGPLLPPDDRLWRHPSELSWAPRHRAAGPRPPRTWAVALSSGLAGAVLAVGIVALVGGFDGGVRERIVERVPVDDGLAALTAKEATDGVPDVAAAVSPSVVRLDVLRGTSSTTGSGVVFRDDGTLLTNAHVVRDADEVTVVLADGTGVPASVVGVDPLTDVAVVTVDERHRSTAAWVPAVLGTARDLEVGEPAIAVGSPLGLAGGPSVTVGVVSGLHRRVTADGVVLHDMIQTDAPIAHGSSGGALCNGAGVVIGITTALASGDGGGEGLGFATPVDLARTVAEQLLDDGVVRRSWLGIEGADLEPTAASIPGLEGIGGVEVADVVAGGPADAGGIRPGDVIVGIAGRRVLSMSVLQAELRLLEPDDEVDLDVLRGGEQLTLTVVLGERP